MKKGAKIFAFVILGLVLTSFLISAVSAATVISGFGDKLSSLVDTIFSGSTNTKDYVQNILSPEILFGLLIFLVVFAIISTLPLFKDGAPWIKTTLSIVVGILAGGFIDPSWIKPLINQYSALGVTISFVLPFVLIFYFMKKTIPSNAFLQRFVWTVFGIAILFNAIINWNSTDTKITKTLYIILIIAALVMILFAKKILGLMFKEGLKEQLSERTREAQASLTAQIAQDQEKLSQLTGAARAALEAKIARNRAALLKLTE